VIVPPTRAGPAWRVDRPDMKNERDPHGQREAADGKEPEPDRAGPPDSESSRIPSRDEQWRSLLDPATQEGSGP
jgi:hypothetical protein